MIPYRKNGSGCRFSGDKQLFIVNKSVGGWQVWRVYDIKHLSKTVFAILHACSFIWKCHRVQTLLDSDVPGVNRLVGVAKIIRCHNFMKSRVLLFATALLCSMNLYLKAEAAIPNEKMALGGIQCTNSIDSVKSIYGKPGSVTKLPDGEIKYTWGNSFFIITDKHGNVVQVMTTANNGIKTPDGIHVGMHVEVNPPTELRSVYGKEDSISVLYGTAAKVKYSYKNNGDSFIIRHPNGNEECGYCYLAIDTTNKVIKEISVTYYTDAQATAQRNSAQSTRFQKSNLGHVNLVNGLVSADQLFNRQLLHWNLTEEQYLQCYNQALRIATPLVGLPKKEQIKAIANQIMNIFLTECTYSTSAPHFLDAYGYFVNHAASCQGGACAAGMCLNILGIDYEHVNHNKWLHQWCRIKMDDGSYWICDGYYGPYAGPEPAPYMHPYWKGK